MNIIKKRVRAIIKNGNEILLIHRIKKEREYWVFPGGGIEKTDKDNVSALIRECKEELGVEVLIGDLFTVYKFEGVGEERYEYFYFCEITSGVLGTGSGSEFQEGTNYKGMYALEWISLKDFSSKNIQPKEVKKKLQKGVYYIIRQSFGNIQHGKDFVKKYGIAKIKKMSREERFYKICECEEKYTDETEKYGIDRLEIVEKP